MTRRILTLALAALVALFCFGAVALASGETDVPVVPQEETTEVVAPETDDGEHADHHGTAEMDEFEGAEGDDRYNGHAGDDHIVGGAGDDVLRGGKGDDDLDGGDGDDRIRGGKDEDSLDGGDGDDLINARGDGRDGDEVTCGEGVDSVKLGRGDTISDATEENPLGSCEEVKGPKAGHKGRGHRRAACEPGAESAKRGGKTRPAKGEKCRPAKLRETVSQ